MTASLPRIMTEFGITASVGQWLTTGYLLVMGIMIPCTGYLMEHFSSRKLYLISVSLFFIGCAAAAFSPNIYLLLLARGAGAGGRNPSAASPGCGIPALPARRARHHYGHCRAHHRICAGFWPYLCRMDCRFIWLAEYFLYYVRPCCPEHCIGHSKTSGRRKAFGRKAGYPLRNTVNHRLLRSFDWRLQPGDLRLFLTCSLRSSGGGDSVHRAFLPAAAEASLPSS